MMTTATLTRVRRLCPSTMDFRFEAQGAVSCKPGQFFRFTFTDRSGQFERSYTLSSRAAGGRTLDLVVSEVPGGRASRFLFTAQPGATVGVEGPYGKLTLPDELPGRLILVATSVGVAPYLPMLDELAARSGPGAKAVLLLGVRDTSEILYAQQLFAFARTPYCDLRVCLSRADPVSDVAFVVRGYVQAQLAALAPDPSVDAVMLCGNPVMIDECYAQLRERGFGPRQVKREKYVFALEAAAETVKPSAADKALIAAKLEKYRT
jgi:NAD(P)H-flavin reductase